MKALRESFIPLFGVLLGLIALTAYFDGRASDLAKKETVIVLAPVAGGWDNGRLTDEGMVEAGAGAELDATERPEILAARDDVRRGALADAEARLEAALGKTPDDTLVESELALVRLRQGRLEEAASLLDAVLRATPDAPSAHFNRALVAARQKDPDLARRHYEKVMALKPKHFEACFNLGLLELEQNRSAEAKRYFAAAVERGAGTEKARALFSRGVAEARLGETDPALASYVKAIEYAPSYLLPRYNQVVILLGKKDPSSLAEATKVLSQMLALRPDFAPAWFLKGRMASEAGDLEGALTAYEKASAHDPTFFKARYNAALVALDMDKVAVAEQRFERLVVDFPDRPEPLFNLGRIAHKRDDQKAAVAAYKKAIALRQGKYPEAQLNLAVSLRAAGELEEALATLDALVLAEPTMASAHLNRGLVLSKLKRTDEARNALEAAIRIKPDYASAHYNLGKLEGGVKRHEAAATAYARALALDPKMAKAAVNLGAELADLERWDEAIAAYRQAIAIAPEDVPAHFNLALALRAKGQLEDAIQEYQRVIELDEGHLPARRNLGIAYGKLGRDDLAVKTYQQALDFDASHVAIRHNLANAFRRLGRLEEAKIEYERVLRLDPGHRGASAALAAMAVADGRYQRALELLQPFIDNGRITVEMRQTEAAARRALGDTKGAEEALAKAKALQPNDPEPERPGKDAEPILAP